MIKHFNVRFKNHLGNYSYYFCIENDEKLIIYYPVPKNANSSIKLFLMKQFGYEKTENDFPTLPEYEINKDPLLKKNYWEIVNFAPIKQIFSPAPNKTPDNKIIEKFCIFRDPIQRFVSCYKNRVLFHQDENVKGKSIDDILGTLKDRVCDNLHFLPQNIFLGDDPSYFDHVYLTKNLKDLERYLNNFFKKDLTIPKIQDGGSSQEINLNNHQLEILYDVYKYDFEFMEKINHKE